MALDQNLFRNWIDGDTFSARDYVYERNSIIAYINSLPTLSDFTASTDTRYYLKTQLDTGQLDDRYYTETELLTTGVLDTRYYREGEVNGLFTTERNRLSRLESKFDSTVLAENDQLFDQAVNTDSAVEFTSVKLGANIVTEAFIDGLENKYTVAGANSAFINQDQLGVAGGVATLEAETGRLPLSQLPLNTVVFKGTFGYGLNDLPTVGVTTGDFYICTAVDSELGYYASAVAGINFFVGDKAVYDGTTWFIIDNTETVTSVNEQIGHVVLDFADVGAAPVSHPHGNVTNEGKIGEVGDLIVTTGTDGTLVTANRSGIDSRVSFPPGSHSHGNITNTGAIGATDNLVAVTGANGVLTTASREGIDSRTEYPPVAHNHDDLYYTQTQLNPLAVFNENVLDARYFTQTQIIQDLAGYVPLNQKGVADGVVPLNAQTKIDATYLPSYVDDVVEGYYDSANDLFYEDVAFSTLIIPLSGKIFVDLTTKKIYRYSGSGYFEIAANSVNSVNGYTGVITLAGSDLAIEAIDIDINAVAFDGVLDTDDTTLDVALATIDAHTHAYSAITDKPLLYTQGEVNAFLAEKADVSALSATITLYPTTAPVASIAGYFTMVNDITDVRYNTTVFNFETAAINSQNQLLASLATDPNIFVGNPGIIDVTTIGNIRKTAGNSNAFAEFYYTVSLRDSAGTETLIATSLTTGAINPDDNLYREFSAHALLNNGTFTATDRLVIKYYANAIEGTTSRYEFQFGGLNPVRTFLPVPVRVLQSAEKIVYDPSNATIVATNLQDAVDELDTLIQQNTSVIKIQRFVITNDNGGADGTFTYTYNGASRNGTIASGQYRFALEDSVQYIIGQNRLEIKVNNDVNFYSPDLEIEEINTSTIGITYGLATNDEVFIKVYQGLDSVALDVPDDSITTAKLSQGLQTDLASYETHIGLTNNPHTVTKAQVGLEFVTNDAQIKADASGSVDGNIATWSGTNGDQLGTGYGIVKSPDVLANSDFVLATSKVIKDTIDGEVSTLTNAIGTKQDTLVSGTNIKTLNGATILGSGDYVIDIPSVDIATTAPDIQAANEGDLWWDSTSAVLYIAYDDGSSKQWVEVSYASVEAAINDLIAGAPGALDTLNELAAALGDDPNFATTIANAIALKANQTEVDTLTTTVGAKADKVATFVTLSANRTLELTDGGKVLDFTNSAAVTITVPANATIAFPVGTQIAVLRNGTGTVTFAGASGVTVHSKDAALAIAGQYASAVLLKKATNTWQLIGSLE